MKQVKFYKSSRGFAVVVLIIILVLATAIGIWGLTTSRTSFLKAGSRKFATELTYQSEQALQKAVRRIQTITTLGGTDQVAITNAADNSPGKTGGDYNSKNINFLVNSSAGGLCADTSCGGVANAACANFDPVVNFDIVDQNVVCNFLGVVDKSTQVSVVRKNDLNTNGELFGIFLVNAVSMDSSGRKQAIQGVVVVPYSGSGAGPYASTGAAYLASSKIVSD